MSHDDTHDPEGLSRLMEEAQAEESDLLAQVAAGSLAADDVAAGTLDEDPETQALLLELSAPPGDAFMTETLAKVRESVGAAATTEATGTGATETGATVISMAAFRRRAAATITTLAVAAGVLFVVLRGPGPDDAAGPDAQDRLDSVSASYSIEVVTAPRAERDEAAPIDAAGDGSEQTPLSLTVPDSGEVAWVLRPDVETSAEVKARVYGVQADGSFEAAGDELSVKIAPTGAVRVSLTLDDAPYVRGGADVDLVVVVGDDDDPSAAAGRGAVGVKAPGTRRYIRLTVR